MNQSMGMESDLAITKGDIWTWHTTEVTLLPLIMLVGMVGNLLVFYVNHFRLPSSTDTLFKRLLAIADLADLSIAAPLQLHNTIVLPDSLLYVPFCRCLSYVALWSALVAGEVLLVIAVDRYLKLCLLRKSGLEINQIKKIMVGLILYSSAAVLPTLWIYDRSTVYFLHYQVTVCYCFLQLDTVYWFLLLIFCVVLSMTFLVVLAMLTVLYFKIVVKLRELSNKHDRLKDGAAAVEQAHGVGNMGKGDGGAVAGGNRQSDAMRRSSVMFIAVTVTFFACYAPYLMILLLQGAGAVVEGRVSPTTKAVLDLCKLTPLVLHVMNPLIYVAFSDQLVREVKRMFRSWSRGRKHTQPREGYKNASHSTRF